MLDEARAAAKTQAQQQLESEFFALQENHANLQKQSAAAREELDLLAKDRDAIHKEIDTLTKRAVKLKSLAKSINYAWSNMPDDNTALDGYSVLHGLDIEDLLPEQDLNCLTMKDLRSRYTNLRSQIVKVCKGYEVRYTTKTNATLYKLMVLGMEAELENILHKLKYGNLDDAQGSVCELTSKYYSLAAEGNQSIAPTLKRFIDQIEYLYIDVVKNEHEYYVQRERAREEQRALKEQMRQEAEDRKRLEAERKKIEAEESKYQIELERLTQQMQIAHDAELDALRKRLEEVTSLLGTVEEKKTEIINLQNGKAGTVYIISNIGSFGEHVFKIGMTRRLEPQDRVNELGDASVPFPFDVHSFIFSEDAVALETALHHELNNRRVNKVNLRKEFFDISVEELQALVERIDPTAPFRVTALAEQYRQSMSINEVP